MSWCPRALGFPTAGPQGMGPFLTSVDSTSLPRAETADPLWLPGGRLRAWPSGGPGTVAEAGAQPIWKGLRDLWGLNLGSRATLRS